MPTQQVRPSMFAPRDTQRLRDIPDNAQLLADDRGAPHQPDQYHHCQQYNRHMHSIQAAVPQLQGQQYQAWSPALAPSPSFVPTGPIDDVHSTSTVQQPRIVQRTTPQRPRTANKARETGTMFNGVVQSSLFKPASAETPSRYALSDTARDSEDDRGQSCFVGCKPVHPGPLITSPYCSNRPQNTLPEFVSEQSAHSLVPLPATVPYSHGLVSRPPFTPSHFYQDGPMPSPPYVLEVEPPDAESWDIPVNYRVAHPEHLELHFGEQIRPPLAPAELEGSRLPLVLLQPTPLSLSTSNYFINYGAMQPLAEQDAGNGAEVEYERIQEFEESDQGPPILPEIAVDATISVLEDDQQQPIAKWYEYYKVVRAWTFEDTDKKYEATYVTTRNSGPVSGGPNEDF